MYFRKIIFFISCFLVFFIACKSHDSSNDDKKIVDVSYSDIFILSVEKSFNDSSVVCGCQSNASGGVDLNKLLTEHECIGRGEYGNEKSGVFIEKSKFEAMKFPYLNTTVSTVDIDEFKLLKAQFDDVAEQESKGYFSTIGKGSDLCSTMSSDVHIVAVQGTFTSSTLNYTTPSRWEKYIDPASKQEVWKDTIKGHLWTMGEDTSQKNLTDAMKYCDNLEYAGFSDWSLPNQKDMNDMHQLLDDEKFENGKFVNTYKANSVIPKFLTNVHETKWWISQKLDSNSFKAMQYLVKDKNDTQKDEFKLVDRANRKDKLYVICVK